MNFFILENNNIFRAKPKAHNIVKISPKFKENSKFLKSLKEINNSPINIRKNKVITFFLILFFIVKKHRKSFYENSISDQIHE